MVNEHASWFYKSPEQVAAYKAIGLPHPDQVFDGNYNQFLQKTAKSPAELNQTLIHGITRVLIQTGEEYLVYSMTEHRFDGLGNEHSFFRSNLGMFYKPIPEYRLRNDQYGYEEKYVHGVRDRRVQFSIPFTKANVENIRKQGAFTQKTIVEDAEKREKLAEDKKVIPSANQPTGSTIYSIKRVGIRGAMLIDSYEDWLNGDFDILWRYGKANPTKEERERMDEYSGTAASALRMSQQQDFANPNNANPNDIMEKVKDAVDNIKKNKMVKEPYK